jgi:hypothetical protein
MDKKEQEKQSKRLTFRLLEGNETNEEKKNYYDWLVEQRGGLPIGFSIENKSNKIFENVTLFNYDRERKLNELFYKSDVIEYDTILRYLTGINKSEDKMVNDIYIFASSDIKGNAEKQINDETNHIKIVHSSIDGRIYSVPRFFKHYNIEDKSVNAIAIPMNCNLYNRVDFLISKIEPFTKLNFLIFPTKETNYF